MVGKKSREEAVSAPPAINGIELDESADYMSEGQLDYFRALITEWRKTLMEGVDRTVETMHQETMRMADESDRASREEHFSIELRTRDRERKLITKLEETLDRIDADDYGNCTQCSEPIGLKRLEARPTATLCISCKQLQEMSEGSA